MTTTSTTLSDRQLDAALAERLFGWAACDPEYRSSAWEFTDPGQDRIVYGRGFAPLVGDPDIRWPQQTHRDHYSTFPAYSSSGDGMLAVLEAMRERGWCMVLRETSSLVHAGRWLSVTQAQFWHRDTGVTRTEDAPTLPRAVAEAAKAALEAEVAALEAQQ